MKNNFLSILLAAALCTQTAIAAPPDAPPCRPINTDAADTLPTGAFTQGLLWQLHKAGSTPSYLFGTIHLADDALEPVLAQVAPYLAQSKAFLMEALPQPQQLRQLQMLMLFSGGAGYLYDYIPPGIYQRTVDILAAYHLPAEAVSRLRPWGAYLYMSYPPNLNKVLDERLYELAVQAGIERLGLETMSELGQVFSAYSLAEQAQLLIDRVCHYALLEQDFEQLLALYLAGDLQAMYRYSQRYSFEDNALYEDLAQRLLHDRNAKMAERIHPWLRQGGAFVAVGALHLPGADGLLAVFAGRGYTVRAVPLGGSTGGRHDD